MSKVAGTHSINNMWGRLELNICKSFWTVGKKSAIVILMLSFRFQACYCNSSILGSLRFYFNYYTFIPLCSTSWDTSPLGVGYEDQSFGDGMKLFGPGCHRRLLKLVRLAPSTRMLLKQDAHLCSATPCWYCCHQDTAPPSYTFWIEFWSFKNNYGKYKLSFKAIELYSLMGTLCDIIEVLFKMQTVWI